MNYIVWTQTTGYSPNTCPAWVEYFGKRGDTPKESLRERKNFGAMSVDW
jgi:hypothetical protein